ncbi:MAG: orotidine-5'-phosphate decarboxylase [Fibrobacter sp.]|jgi:orotidine-5'-phosphate decarboxylase|uniref:orotidine-5'-phosphate decarboxylase n=1 Tax=Fibrobacter sp. TaxID=35828 RepID=UPI001B1E4449|nr:orotidine-5'-phosphate decarboxylase [Fibrobacter sp.]MBO4713114.1 orotidine-5'-phosphate decarboxylase [Fibrobacter sp.]MBO7059575.1 orotidine-5'-phosphate decarboxylase [Fibrobacter sp.]MBO7106357.1 orotidine-5'-phosphate decarboxylase [Fibrobacter sp.]MBO7550120.1 orotidine-5'-phosphate decarboxylase [Fibrobacter sp.]MBQ3714979.1 orotidine-5'-phosphate decarboxylase [Fibrobacter sp.]
MTCFYDRLEQRIAACGNPVCMGMDPVLKLIPLEGTPEDKIKRFYSDILECCAKRNVFPAVVKPNSAYYECVSVQAMLVLQQLIADYRSAGIPVILDAKRGDIGKSSAAYANAAYDVYGADAVTVSPWMGTDSVSPFIRENSENGAYVLLRTSNKGAHDFQDMNVLRGDDPRDVASAFYSVADKIVEWDDGKGYLGAVVGATHPEELEQITAYCVAKKHEIPFLIPGVSIPGVPGGQGGDAKTVLNAIANGGGKRKFHVLNSSSGLNFAWQRNNTPANFANDCVDALERLADSLR